MPTTRGGAKTGYTSVYEELRTGPSTSAPLLEQRVLMDGRQSHREFPHIIYWLKMFLF